MKIGAPLANVLRMDAFADRRGHYRIPEAGDIIQSENSGKTYLIDHAERTFMTVAGGPYFTDQDGRFYRLTEDGRRYYRWNLRLVRVSEVDDGDVTWRFGRYKRDS